MARKTWTEKLENGREPKVVRLDRPYAGVPEGARLLIATPRVVRDYVDAIPRGESRTVARLRTDLAAVHGADATCPTSTGIFVRIVAEAALEDLAMGKSPSEVTPFWRLIDPTSAIARKLTCGPELLARQRASETA